MSRTPLFDLIRRSMHVARDSFVRGRPAGEVLEQGRERRALSRREFLAASASLAAAAAVAGCVPGSGTRRARAREDPTVLVVGAGIAGLTVAYRLKQRGVRVRVLEAQERVGGRIFSLRGRFPEGQVVELGGELIDTNHATVRALAAELGLVLDDLAADDPGIARDVWFFDGRRRSEAEVVEGFLPVARRIEADLASLRGDGTISYREPNGAEPLDRLSIAEWLDRAAVDGWIRELLTVGYVTEFGLETGEQSALNLLTMIDPDPEPFRIYGESDERFHVRGGNDGIPQALAARLTGEIETGALIEAVRQRGDGSFACSVRRGASSRELLAAQVVLAIPFTLLRSVRLDLDLPPAKRRAIDELGYGTNAKLMVGFAERVWRTAHRSNGSVLTDLPFQLTWETSRRQPGRAGILTNFTGGEHGLALGRGTAAEQAGRFGDDLDRVFAGASAAREGMTQARFHWPSFPFTLGSYACYRPGQWTAFAGAEGEPVGNLHFAGEHCSLEAQGFMEGGCETGERAAREVLAAMGLLDAALLPKRRGRRVRRGRGLHAVPDRRPLAA